MVPLILKKSNDDNYKKNCILKCYILFNIYFLINLNLFQKKKGISIKKMLPMFGISRYKN